MKLTLANVKKIKRNSSSPLTKRVCNYVIGEWSDYSDKKNIFTDVLYHGCQSGIVGELIYYTDMVREESLIFFIRNKQEPNTPFVTVEYSISQKKVLQCYGEHDHKPNEEVLHYVNKVWLPYANRTLKQIAA